MCRAIGPPASGGRAESAASSLLQTTIREATSSGVSRGTLPLLGFETKRRTETACNTTADLWPAKVEEIDRDVGREAVKRAQVSGVR